MPSTGRRFSQLSPVVDWAKINFPKELTRLTLAIHNPPLTQEEQEAMQVAHVSWMEKNPRVFDNLSFP